MNILIIGCGWVGTFTAANLLKEGHHVWGTTTSADKCASLRAKGISSVVVDFDSSGEQLFAAPDDLLDRTFDAVIISVPITYKDSMGQVETRFARLLTFLQRLSFEQVFFFGSVGIYPKVSATIIEDTFPDAELEPRLLKGENMLRAEYPKVTVLRLGGLFGLERVMAKHFVDKICEIGYQTANFVHIVDIHGIIKALISQGVQGRTYNVVSPEHPLKKDVIVASAHKYGYGLPAGFSTADRTAKVVSSNRVINELNYQFVYPTPLEF